MIVLNKGLDGFIHGLMPRQLREDLKPNTAAYIRARALTSILVVVTTMAALSNLVLGGIHLLNNPLLLKHDLIPLGILFMLALQTWLFYRFNNYWASGLAFTNFYFLGVVILLILSGGYEFHGKTILLTCPMISFVIGSRQEGIQNAALCIVFFFVLVFLHAIEFKLPNVFYAQDSHMLFNANWVFSIAVVATTLVVYEMELQNRDARVHARLNPARQNRSQHGMSEFKKHTEEWLHSLLPARLRGTLSRHSMIYARTQILTILLLVATLLCFFTAILIMGLDLIFHPEQFRYDAMILLIAFCFALQTWLFYKYNNLLLSGAALGHFTFLVIVSVVLLSGGYESPVIILMLICPAGFFMISGMRDGVINAFMIAIIGITLSNLNYIGFDFTDYFHDAARHITAGIAWFIAITAIMVCMMIYDGELEKL